MGLSPQVRGNPEYTSTTAALIGSIPAGAGEPANNFFRRYSQKVYPRRCGGTNRAEKSWNVEWGLSPQVRGNLDQIKQELEELGSIPAGAGEPIGRKEKTNACKVYPRRCGGTQF